MATTYLTNTFSSPTNNYKWTLSVWVKRSGLGANQYIFQTYPSGQGYSRLYFDDTDKIQFDGNDTSQGNAFDLKTTRLFRDTNAWYHIVLKWDVTQGTASNRVKIYVNGVEEGNYGTETYPAQNVTYPINRDKLHNIGRHNTDTNTYFDGVMSHFHFTDGYSYDATTFGSTDSTTGEWKINTSPSITMGTNGFTILKDGMTITDQSSNSNNWTLANGTLTKTEDCPSNVFATMNPLSSLSTFSQGNNRILFSSGSGYQTSTSTLGMVSGKFYAEMKIQIEHNNYPGIGIAATNSLAASKMDSDWLGEHSDTYGYYLDGAIYNNGSSVTSGQTTFTTGDIVGLALDLDSTQNTLKYYKNGALVYTLNINTNSNGYMFASTTQTNTANAAAEWNFGNGVFGTGNVSSAGTNASNNGIFEYDVPTGYTALSTKGLNL
jgi:hypothetical protein